MTRVQQNHIILCLINTIVSLLLFYFFISLYLQFFVELGDVIQSYNEVAQYLMYDVECGHVHGHGGQRESRLSNPRNILYLVVTVPGGAPPNMCLSLIGGSETESHGGPTHPFSTNLTLASARWRHMYVSLFYISFHVLSPLS